MLDDPKSNYPSIISFSSEKEVDNFRRSNLTTTVVAITS